MAGAKVLATDVHLRPPEGGLPQRFARGTKASELPDWVKQGKATDALGRETEEPLLGDHVWAEEQPDPHRVASGPGETGFAFGADIPLLQESDTPIPVEPEPRKTSRR